MRYAHAARTAVSRELLAHGLLLFPIPDSRFPIPDSRFPIPDFRFPIPDSLWYTKSDKVIKCK
ncbi:MAG: hypothetical protein F6K63_20770 [Moorea sp. SIO1G6]|uniref:hypothetical protein n=1 Tax=Moorena sp. SIO1G6 TaxID=2607840 RepID=UPI0013C19E7B|nr:hypothetical protein [Moorena sp. SIO1G6]NET66686.1 hypothetical protein [Moorena sp. SIO1G6]